MSTETQCGENKTNVPSELTPPVLALGKVQHHSQARAQGLTGSETAAGWQGCGSQATAHTG